MITLTTDFGLSDAFVGTMKGVILSIARQAQIVDISHTVPAQNIVAGALLLEEAYSYFPIGAIHLAVVDPGVGSARSALAVQTERYSFIAPDNGLLDLVLRRERIVKCVKLSNPKMHRLPVSATFHGRDIFAPAAAHLENGTALDLLGEPAKPASTVILPVPIKKDGGLEVHVLRIDHFGNLITDLTQQEYTNWNSGGRVIKLTAGHRTIHGLWSTFSDVPQGEPVAYFGSSGRLEVAVHLGRAIEVLQLRAGSAIQMSFAD
jgi:S-adenosylmethionine hydrolase